MSFIREIREEEASGETAALYEANRGGDGRLPNFVKAFSHRPEVYVAWQGLLGAIKKDMEPRRYELATLAAAKALSCSYCCLAHGSVLLNGLMSAEELAAVADDARVADLSPVESAVMELASAVATDASSVAEEQVGKLRALGLDEGEICDVVAAAAARSFFSKYLDGTGTLADAKYARLPGDLPGLLTVGRGIE